MPQDPGVVDALELVSTYGERVVLDTTRDTHRAVARRVFGLVNGATGGAGRLPQLLHDGIATTVYASLGATLHAGGVGLRSAGSAGIGPRLEDSRRGRFVRTVANGLVGDRFAEEGNRLALGMVVRLRDEDVDVDLAGLAAAYPGATSHLAVLLHGLVEDDSAWQYAAAVAGRTYLDTLVAAGWTPVVLRYNSGLTLRENGVALAGMLRDLVAAWPVEVDRIALVGHSMGGLVARAACVVGIDADRPWADLVTDVVTLGTPHLGSPVAQGAALGARALARFPETAGFAKVLDLRSVGILDLESGLAEDVAPMPGVRYRLVAATLSRSSRHPVGALAGDLLVRLPSAYGWQRHSPQLFPDADILHLPRTHHLGLLNHPEVHTALADWLA